MAFSVLKEYTAQPTSVLLLGRIVADLHVFLAIAIQSIGLRVEIIQLRNMCHIREPTRILLRT